MGIEKYTKGKILGKGSFGKAYIAVDKTDATKYVMKEIDISKMPRQERESSLQEAQLLKALKHPNIVSCKETFIERGTLCIIMDYCSEGDLYQALQKRKGNLVPEEQILDWIVQLCLGLKHVHDRKILHRDLKSQNVFVSKGGLLKLGDFGVSKVLNSTHHLASTAVGTPYYLSPEICQNKKYNQKSDIWSLGCLLYEITSLKHAFEAGSLKLLIHKIIRGQYPPLSSRYSQDLRALIDKMITKDPNRRPSINQILQEPIIKNRIHGFLSATMRADEFSHTIIHQRPKPGQLVAGAAGATATSASSQLPSSRFSANAKGGVNLRQALPSQAPPRRSKAQVVASSSERQRAGQMPPASAASDVRRIAANSAVKEVDERRAAEASEKADAARKLREERQRLEAERRAVERKRLDEERKRLEDQRRQMEAGLKAAEEARRAEALRAQKASELESRRQAEAERLRARAESEKQLRERQAEDRRQRLVDMKAEEERKEADKRAEKERQDAARQEFIQRQRDAMRNRQQVEEEVVVRVAQPAARPDWQDVTVPDIKNAIKDEARGYREIHGDFAPPSAKEVSDRERRRIWEENQTAVQRNRAKAEDPPRPSNPRRRWGDDRPDLAHLPMADRRRVRAEEQARAREAELKEFQRRNWEEMRAAAERNRRQLAGDGSAPAAEPPESSGQGENGRDHYEGIDDEDVAEHAAMCQEMAHIYNSGNYDDDGFENDEDDEDEDEDGEYGDGEKEDLRKTLSRFTLNGVEIDLGVADEDSLPARVEALRIYLEEHLGFDAFVRVYQLMENVSQDDDENQIMEEIFKTLGVDRMPYLQLIHQLIICEESMHSGKV